MKSFLVRYLYFSYNAGIVVLLFTVSAAVSAEALAPVVEATSIQVKQNSLIESRLSKLERLIENQVLMNLSLRLNELENQLQQLQGDVELQTHNQEEMGRRQQALYLDIDQRLEVLETASNALNSENSDLLPIIADENLPLSAMPESDEMIPGAILVTTEGVVSEVTEPPSQGFTSSSDPALDYSEAYSLLKNGQYDEAINAFQSFLENHPETEYADNAQYWLGEANYVTRRFGQAVNEFGLVVSDYSTSHKVPGALLKIGYAHYELEEWSQARSSLERLVSQFSTSSAARLAENRLKRMEEEGR